jgi:hypothetical protein
MSKRRHCFQCRKQLRQAHAAHGAGRSCGTCHNE